MAVLDAQAPRHGACQGAAGAAREFRITRELADGGAERRWSCRRGLVVWPFGLDHAHEDAAGVVDQVLIEDVMLHGCTIHPYRVRALNQCAYVAMLVKCDILATIKVANYLCQHKYQSAFAPARRDRDRPPSPKHSQSSLTILV